MEFEHIIEGDNSVDDITLVWSTEKDSDGRCEH